MVHVRLHDGRRADACMQIKGWAGEMLWVVSCRFGRRVPELALLSRPVTSRRRCFSGVKDHWSTRLLGRRVPRGCGFCIRLFLDLTVPLLRAGRHERWRQRRRQVLECMCSISPSGLHLKSAVHRSERASGEASAAHVRSTQTSVFRLADVEGRVAEKGQKPRANV